MKNPSPFPSLLLCLVLALAVGCRPQQEPQAGEPAPAEEPAGSEHSEGQHEHGHGHGHEHHVHGRVPAKTMSYLGADWLTRESRDAEEEPEKMLDALGLEPGMRVADIGAGVGFHVLRIAPRVEPGGHVWATDIQPEMLEMLRENTASLENVTAVLATQDDTGLPKGGIDLALMVDVYHEIPEPMAFLAQVRDALAPGGRLVLVEFRGEDPEVPIKEEHKMTRAQAELELKEGGFELIEHHDFLPWQHILVFAVEGEAR